MKNTARRQWSWEQCEQIITKLLCVQYSHLWTAVSEFSLISLPPCGATLWTGRWCRYKLLDKQSSLTQFYRCSFISFRKSLVLNPFSWSTQGVSRECTTPTTPPPPPHKTLILVIWQPNYSETEGAVCPRMECVGSAVEIVAKVNVELVRVNILSWMRPWWGQCMMRSVLNLRILMSFVNEWNSRPRATWLDVRALSIARVKPAMLVLVFFLLVNHSTLVSVAAASTPTHF